VDSISSTITGIGLLWAAAVGLLYFFSRDFRARKKKEWQRKGRLTAMTEWAEWLFSIFVVVIILVAIIAAYISFYQRT
jgi:heme/copper-type cytochrome/quinol oxidase subunit 2